MSEAAEILYLFDCLNEDGTAKGALEIVQASEEMEAAK